MNQSEIISKNLCKIMLKTGITLQEIAQKSGVSEFNLELLTEARGTPTQNKINRIAKALDCTPEDLTKEHKKKNKYSINEIDMMAKKEGLSYGQIVAKYGL